MGAGAPVTATRNDERSLYKQLAALLDEEKQLREARRAEWDDCPPSPREDLSALSAACSQIVRRWEEQVHRQSQIIYCDLVDIETAMEVSWAEGKTPIVLDVSEDSKFATFCSYQPDMIPLDAKSMILTASAGKKDLFAALEVGRRFLVAAMATGKTLHVKLGTSAPDFVGILNDSHSGVDTSAKRSAFFPLELFQCGGAKLHDPTLEQSIADGLLLDMPDKDNDMVVAGLAEGLPEERQSPAVEGSHLVSTRTVEGSHLVSRCNEEEQVEEEEEEQEEEEEEVKDDAGGADSEINILPQPRVAATQQPKRLSWAERLFREADMRPHKEFAICRRSFKVFLSGTVLAKDALGHYWRDDEGQGQGQGGGLPPYEWFQIIQINNDEEEKEEGVGS